MRSRAAILVAVAVTVVQGGCGGQLGLRTFAGPVEPMTGQGDEQLVIGDDRGITYT